MTECSDQSKTCKKCLNVLLLSNFPKNSRFKDGHNSRCKECCNTYNKESRNSNIEKYKQTRSKNYQKNIEKMRQEKRLYYSNHVKEKQSYDIEYRAVNKNKIKNYKRNWELKNRDNPIFKLKRNLRRRVHHALKGRNKSQSTFNLLGCSVDFFRSHIESLWSEGMSWENYGPKGWHIDHIQPCHLFDLSIPEEQNKCFHFSNQRPLWAIDNLRRTNIEYLSSMNNKDGYHQFDREDYP